MSTEVRLSIRSGVGVISWDPGAAGDHLAEDLRRCLLQAWRSGTRRVETQIPVSDASARRAVHQAGMRREGCRRKAAIIGGVPTDVLLYAILPGEPTEGAEGFSAVMDSVLPTKRVIGHALIRDPQKRVLLLETRYKPDWELPGGVVEPGEPPRRGTAREITEELGIEVEIGQPALVDWMPEYLGWSDAIEFIFDLGVLDESRRAAMRPGAEIRALHWVCPADIGSHVTELSRRRIELLIQGYRGHTEAGYPAG